MKYHTSSLHSILPKQFERDEYNKTVELLTEEIDYLKVEMQKYIKIIEDLNNKAS